MNVPRSPLGSSITALLGPTNTGKTHRCVGRMLEYDTGMLGLPLRLLAREVYDRVRTAVGSDQVALVTGEERHVPRSARFWICTTEAMPTDLEVDFVGVDEVQLAAHPKRGHVFTERILHARGRYETWFLGASTIGPVLRDLVPTVQFRAVERLSRLSYAGDIRLGQLPARSAVVAFSIPKVYAMAERLRARHGGVAVVLGALSPRTRNAQVAMYQAGEVDHLVATDAIGMGLNMSIGHVSLSALHKFDGQRQRGLSSSELAQIAGRAGRSIHDGSFSTLSPLRLDPSIADSIVNHRFPALRYAVWRNNDLSYDSLDDLGASLMASPRHPRLRLVQQADDSTALALLSRFEPARKRVRSRQQVQLLWEVCQIPDYRKLLPELHAQLLFSIYEQLETTGCQLDDDWVARQIAPLESTHGDLDTLLSRIAFVRTWTYVSQRRNWVRQARHWQEHMAGLEDRLSDALHERLMTRFVQRTRNRSAARARSAVSNSELVGAQQVRAPFEPEREAAESVDPHHPFAALARMRERMSRSTSAAESRSPEQSLNESAGAWEIHANGLLTYDSEPIARVGRGPSLVLPHVTLVLEPLPRRPAELHERAQSAARNLVNQLLLPLSVTSRVSPAMRGICYQLRSGLGTVNRGSLEPLLHALPEVEAQKLCVRGVYFGRRWVFVRKLLSPAALELRFALARAYFGAKALPRQPPGSRVSLAAANRRAEVACAIGFEPAGPLWIRCDAVERAASAIAQGEHWPRFAAPYPPTAAREGLHDRARESEAKSMLGPERRRSLCGILGCRGNQLGRVLDSLALESQRNPDSARDQAASPNQAHKVWVG